ncbi:hypothetical protein EXN66_Car013155 [Channa argus]|uniref:Uncharacterized protein n=1 Tax=Channa argus TaxID=215402 RepID=A0A6G1Q4K9_CHAAH|nr:hypothetical protein EXN66_Car013155 [Channa argus]
MLLSKGGGCTSVGKGSRPQTTGSVVRSVPVPAMCRSVSGKDTEPLTAHSPPQLCSAGPSPVEIGEGCVRKGIRPNQHADNDPLWRH